MSEQLQQPLQTEQLSQPPVADVASAPTQVSETCPPKPSEMHQAHCNDDTCYPPNAPVELPNGMQCIGGSCQMLGESLQLKIRKWIKWLLIVFGVPIIAYLAYNYFTPNLLSSAPTPTLAPVSASA